MAEEVKLDNGFKVRAKAGRKSTVWTIRYPKRGKRLTQSGGMDMWMCETN